MTDIEHAALRKVTFRLLPFLLFIYVICWLDRVNVGFAALQMNADLGFGPAVYGFGAGVFFAGYALFEVPSNLILARVGARRWIARIMITWGAISTAMMFVHDARTFYLLRFLLGVAEAGFLPGILYYLGAWYPQARRAKAVGWFMSAIPLSIVVGGPLAGLLLAMDGLLHLRGWQWLYLVEGLPAFVLGFFVLAWLPERPAGARWLTAAERDALERRVAAEQDGARARHGVGTVRALFHPTVWALALVMFTCQTGSYGLTLWMPQIIKGLSGLSDLLVGMISALPYIAAAAGMVLIGASSDRSGERFLHVAVPSLVAVAGFVASAWITSPVPALVALTVAAVGDLGSRGPFWALPGRFLSGGAAAGAIALINTIGSLGGFVGPYAVGLVKQYTGSFQGGLMFLALLLALGALGILRLRRSPALHSYD